MHGNELRTPYGQDLSERQLRAEFGRMGGLIHFTVTCTRRPVALLPLLRTHDYPATVL